MYYYDIVDSTMDIAQDLISAGNAHGLIITAKQQTIGRGRYRRKWISPEGGLYFSIILNIDKLSKILSWVTLFSAISIAEVIRKIFKLEALIKWPNDVLIGDKKIAGILTQIAGLQNEYIIIGMGINVNIHQEKLETFLTTIVLELLVYLAVA